MIFAIMSGITVTSCSDEPQEDNIVGKWFYSETEVDDDYYSDISMTLTFNKDKTGTIVESWREETKTRSSAEYRMNFSWTTTSDSNGNNILKVSYVSGDKETELFPGSSNTVLWSRQYVLTGKILNIYSGDGVWVFNKK